MTKQEHDENVRLMIQNLICDEVAFALTNWEPYHSWPEGWAILKEEVEETEEALESIKQELNNVWSFIRTNDTNEALSKTTRLLVEEASNTIHEAIQVAAVARKMLVCLEKDKEKGTTMAATISDALTKNNQLHNSIGDAKCHAKIVKNEN